MLHQSTEPPPSDEDLLRARTLHRGYLAGISQRVDRLFALLVLLQWGGLIALAACLSPDVDTANVASRVWTAVIAGGVLASIPIYFTWKYPAALVTGFSYAIVQAIFSGYLFQLSGQRPETYIHLFGSLALIGLYRDYRVVVMLSATSAVEHAFRFLLSSDSIAGVFHSVSPQGLQIAAWLGFENIVLFAICSRASQETFDLCQRSATLERVNATIEQKVAERSRELREQKQRSERLLTAIRSVLIEVDAEGVVQRWNPSASKLMKVAPETAVGQRLVDLPIDWTDNQVIADMLRATFSDGKAKRASVGVLDAAGSCRDIELSAFSIEENGACHGRLILGDDMTEQNQLQSQVRQKSKLESVGQLAAGVAHEINTPIQYVSDNLTYAMSELRKVRSDMDGFDPDLWGRQYCELPVALNDSLEGIKNVSRIVKTLRELAHPGEARKSAVDLNEVILRTKEVSCHLWKDCAELHCDLESGLTEVQGMPVELSQVFLNLIVNAAYAIADVNNDVQDEKGSIRITSCSANGIARVEIADSGTGIPDSIEDRIFDPFFTTKDVGSGTGQGLAIAHSVVVQQHHGNIWFRNNDLGGATFVVEIPFGTPGPRQQTIKSATVEVPGGIVGASEVFYE